MALRDKLRERTQPLLEPGEQIQEVFLAQTGPSPYLAIITYLIFFAVKRRIIVATDRAIVVVRAGYWSGTSAKEVLDRLPRSTRIGPLRGLWGRTEIGGERLWVHKRFHGDVERADARAVWPAPAPGQPLPPPGTTR